jgi:FAS-associated factor 2
LEQQRKKQQEDQLTRAALEQARLAKLQKEAAKTQLKESVGPEPDLGPDVAELVIRLPDGSRNSRRFYRNASLAQLFNYVGTLDVELPSPYEIVTSYPSTTLHPTEDTLDTAGLFPKAIVHVREPLAP